MFLCCDVCKPSVADTNALRNFPSRKITTNTCNTLDYDTQVWKKVFTDHEIFRGFKLNVIEGESSFKPHIFDGELLKFESKEEYSCQIMMNDIDSVNKIIDAYGSATVSFVLLSGSAQNIHYLQEKVSVKNQKVFVYKKRFVAYSKHVDVSTLTPASNEIYFLDTDEIADMYGTKFVQSIGYGAQIELFYTFKSSKEIEIKEVEGDVVVSIGICPICISFTIKFKDFEGFPEQSEFTVESKVNIIGLDMYTPPNPTYEETMIIIKDFNALYEKKYQEQKVLNFENSNELNGFSPVTFSLGSIADYLPGKITSTETTILNDRMERMNNVLSFSLGLIAQLEAIRKTQKVKYASNPKDRVEIFDPYDLAVDTAITNLQFKVEECLAFRRLPFSAIVGANGIEMAAVPEKYPQISSGTGNTVDDNKIINGLLGKAYLPSPVIVKTHKFEGVFYYGFTIPTIDDDENLVLRPWMSGELRRDDDPDNFIARNNTPAELEKQGFTELNEIDENEEGSNFIRYGDQQVYLQSNKHDDLWLESVERENNVGVITHSHIEMGEGLWIIQSRPYYTDGESTDPKYGKCLQYGDIIYLRDAYSADLISQLSDYQNFGEIENVTQTKDEAQGWLILTENGVELQKFDSILKTLDKIARAGWIVQQIENEHWQGRGQGQCVENLSMIYFINFYDQKMFLQGGVGKHKEDVTVAPKNKTLNNSLQWILRTTPGNGRRDDGLTCGFLRASAQWIPLFSYENDYNLTYEVGIVGRNGVQNWNQNPSWKQSVISRLGDGFNVIVRWIRSSVASTPEIKHYVNSFYASYVVDKKVEEQGIFETEKNTSMPVPFGQAWQFTFEISDLCVSSWSLKTNEIFVTPNSDSQPCCLPGFELDSNNPHGPCRISSPCFCEKIICEPPSPIIYLPDIPTVPPDTNVPPTISEPPGLLLSILLEIFAIFEYILSLLVKALI